MMNAWSKAIVALIGIENFGSDPESPSLSTKASAAHRKLGRGFRHMAKFGILGTSFNPQHIFMIQESLRVAQKSL